MIAAAAVAVQTMAKSWKYSIGDKLGEWLAAACVRGARTCAWGRDQPMSYGP